MDRLEEIDRLVLNNYYGVCASIIKDNKTGKEYIIAFNKASGGVSCTEIRKDNQNKE